jgi:ketosteroid isomerase-like protein
LNRFTVHQIATRDMDVSKVWAIMVPKTPTTQQKANRRDVCHYRLYLIERDLEFFSRVITCDVSWKMEYDPKTKHQSREWQTAKSLRPKKARMSKSKIKSCSVVF